MTFLVGCFIPFSGSVWHHVLVSLIVKQRKQAGSSVIEVVVVNARPGIADVCTPGDRVSQVYASEASDGTITIENASSGYYPLGPDGLKGEAAWGEEALEVRTAAASTRRDRGDAYRRVMPYSKICNRHVVNPPVMMGATASYIDAAAFPIDESVTIGGGVSMMPRSNALSTRPATARGTTASVRVCSFAAEGPKVLTKFKVKHFRLISKGPAGRLTRGSERQCNQG